MNSNAALMLVYGVAAALACVWLGLLARITWWLLSVGYRMPEMLFNLIAG
jgi:hypothetical protein